MQHNPIPAIQSRLIEEIGFTGAVPQRKKFFSINFEFQVVQHPQALKLDLIGEFSWCKPKREVQVAVTQPAVALHAWDDISLNFFFSNLTNAFQTELKQFIPELGNYCACVVPYKYFKDNPDHYFAYLSCIECAEYDLDEVVELTLASFSAGTHVLSHSQSLIKALLQGERALNIGEHIEKMKRQFAEEEKLYST